VSGDDVQGIAGRVTAGIEPNLIVEADRVDDQQSLLNLAVVSSFVRSEELSGESGSTPKTRQSTSAGLR